MSVHTTRHNTTQLGRAKNWWWRSRGASKPPTAAAAAAPNTRHGSVRFGYSPFFQNFTCLSIYIQKIRLFPKCCCAATGKMIPTLNNTIFTFLFFLYFAIPLVAIFCFFIIIIVCFVIIWHKFWKQNHNYRRVDQRQHALSWPALDTNRTKIKTKNFSGLTNGKKWHGNTTQPRALDTKSLNKLCNEAR